MGEYIRYKGHDVKIGTMEDLYYTSYQKYTRALNAMQLYIINSNEAPLVYAKPDSGFRFRFPFPDEDKLDFGQIIEPYNRGIPIKVDKEAEDFLVPGSSKGEGKQFEIEITQQKLVTEHGKTTLALVIRDPKDGESYRIIDEQSITRLLLNIYRNHVIKERDPEQMKFYRELSVRIMRGYQMELPSMKANKGLKQKAIKQRRGKGLR